jgi:hypothetical protein
MDLASGMVANLTTFLDAPKSASLHVNLPTLSQIGSKSFGNLRFIDLTKISPTIVEIASKGKI